MYPQFLGVLLPGNLVLETADLENSFQTLSVPGRGRGTELVDRTCGSLLPLLAIIGYMATCSCKAVWESEDLTFPSSFIGGSARHHGRGEGSSCWGAIHRTCHTFPLNIYSLSI